MEIYKSCPGFGNSKKQWSEFFKQTKELYSATVMKTIADAVDDPAHETDVMALSCYGWNLTEQPSIGKCEIWDTIYPARVEYRNDNAKLLSYIVDHLEAGSNLRKQFSIRPQDLVEARLMRRIVQALFTVSEPDGQIYHTILSLPVDVPLNRKIDLDRLEGIVGVGADRTHFTNLFGETVGRYISTSKNSPTKSSLVTKILTQLNIPFRIDRKRRRDGHSERRLNFPKIDQTAFGNMLFILKDNDNRLNAVFDLLGINLTDYPISEP